MYVCVCAYAYAYVYVLWMCVRVCIRTMHAIYVWDIQPAADTAQAVLEQPGELYMYYTYAHRPSCP